MSSSKYIWDSPRVFQRIESLFDFQNDAGLAKQLEVGKSTVSHYRTGYRPVSLKVMIHVCNQKSKSLEWLLTGNEPKGSSMFQIDILKKYPSLRKIDAEVKEVIEEGLPESLLVRRVIRRMEDQLEMFQEKKEAIEQP